MNQKREDMGRNNMKQGEERFPSVRGRTRWGIALPALAVTLAVTPQIAWAQAVNSQADQNLAKSDDESAEVIVVTGTLLRGTAPGGTQAITVGAEEIAATGAANPSQLLARIPQAGAFNTDPAVRGQSGTAISINRPTLRNLGNAAASSSSTLLLLDNHRLPGMGITQTGPDVDAIPTGAIERVEIVLDGGSSTYGSDA
ncbi:MAG: Plug domain-containing protein, partial [Proteobacteria bacterium]